MKLLPEVELTIVINEHSVCGSVIRGCYLQFIICRKAIDTQCTLFFC